ncbi:PHD finger protein 14 isoform X1 [Homalodisca vitripennis]|uniref:PHD finger protein 14 isoform X1 n=1 Tax=Homalodisca vitripennis TaxID=197043 RepID=UPI001EEADC6D|nr:PHD finger protein 14 isoform X1 [Homalodisca vitripennis]
MERDPTKRKVKPTPPSALIDFDLSGESSDDSDFRIEDHCEESDDDSLDSDDGGKQDADDSKSEEESDDSDENKISVEELLQQAESQKMKASGAVDPVKILICCVCLGDRSDANNEIVECDGCGVTVHEGCYGVSENDSISSTVSSCSTMPWFCEACRAGVDDPTCELCPNFGGIFKETDTGKWVHLVCALYIPGVAFGEVDKLSSVTLFEMAYTKWGARACSLCSDQRFTRTGVCVGCDAGLCRSYFHVTCGQREGLLSEAHSEEVDQADPFYAHCKLHSDKTLVKKRRRNWLALELRTAQRKKQYAMEGHSSLPEQLRIKRKLEKYKQKYCSIKFTRPPPWVPTQKMARPLTSDANVCRMLWRKASLSGVDTQAWALREAQTAALADVHRKWHIPPAFSVEFIGYYLDRNYRIESMKQQLSVLLEENAKLVEEQKEVQSQYDEALKENSGVVYITQTTKATLQKYHDVILKVAPNKKLLNLELLGKPVLKSHHHPLASPLGSVPTLAALKAGVGFPLRQQRETAVGLCVECGICSRTNDQHLMAKCDTCHLHYHLGCLNPPLTRMPKKTKLMGWQCSECDKDSSGSEVECVDPEAPRQLRKLKDNGNGDVTPPVKSEDPPEVEKEKERDEALTDLEVALCSPEPAPVVSGRSGKKRRREKHHRYSPSELPGSNQGVKPHKRKRKHKSIDTPEVEVEVEPNRPALKIFFKSIPHPTGEGSAYAVTPGGAYQASISRTVVTSTPAPAPAPAPSRPTTPRPPPAKRLKEAADAVLLCTTCNLNGTNANIVRCDECRKGFHFHCLDPPVKKSPKVRGYSWHCADCDPTESDSS